jgi:hypothetical protein
LKAAGESQVKKEEAPSWVKNATAKHAKKANKQHKNTLNHIIDSFNTHSTLHLPSFAKGTFCQNSTDPSQNLHLCFCGSLKAGFCDSPSLAKPVSSAKTPPRGPFFFPRAFLTLVRVFLL